MVFDSSALIAWLRLEGEGHIVRRLLRAGRGSCYAHGMNLLEVWVHFARRERAATADRALGIIARAGVQEREDFSADFRREVGQLGADARRAGPNLAYGDAIGLVLARRLGSEFVTTDSREIKAIAAAGSYAVRFIR